MATGLMASLAIMQAGMGVSQVIEGQTAEIQQKEQADILAAEKAKKAKKLLGKQTMAFLKGGVGLSGTPQKVFEETESYAMQDIGNIRSYYENVGKQMKREHTFSGISNILQAGFTSSSMFKRTPNQFGEGVQKPKTVNNSQSSFKMNNNSQFFGRV